MTRIPPATPETGHLKSTQMGAGLSRQPVKWLYSPREVSELTPFPYETVLDMCIAGDIEASKVGRRWVITEAAVKALVQPREATP
jgi:excisionase family DNA binding protein